MSLRKRPWGLPWWPNSWDSTLLLQEVAGLTFGQGTGQGTKIHKTWPKKIFFNFKKTSERSLVPSTIYGQDSHYEPRIGLSTGRNQNLDL